MNIQVIGGSTRLERESISPAPGNAPLSRGRKLTRHEGGTDKTPIEPNHRYEAKVKQENEEAFRKKRIDSLLEAKDTTRLKHFLQELSMYKKRLTENVFVYAKEQVSQSDFPDETKEEFILLINAAL